MCPLTAWYAAALKPRLGLNLRIEVTGYARAIIASFAMKRYY